MNCDLILTENSCRFCLGDAQDGVSIQSTQKSYFCVDKRLVLTSDILSFLNLKIQDESRVLPNMPSKICMDCKISLCSFYSLKKNFQENEAVLIGKIAGPSNSLTKVNDEDPGRAKLLEVVDEFLEVHVGKDIQVAKHENKLVISLQRWESRTINQCLLSDLDLFKNLIFSEQSGEKLKVIVSNEPVKKSLPESGNEQRESDNVEFVCSSCGEILKNTDKDLHKCFDEIKIQPTDSTSPIFFEQIDDLPINSQSTNEEYLDEEESRFAEEYEVMEYDIKDEPLDDITSGDNKPFLCFYCGKPFASRSVSVRLTLKHGG